MQVKYYESHVTLAPDLDKLDKLVELARKYKFRVSDLYMKSGQRSTKDLFASSRGSDYNELASRMDAFTSEAVVNGFILWRKKIEGVLYDQRY